MDQTGQGQDHLGMGLAGVNTHRPAPQRPGLLRLALFAGKHAEAVVRLRVLGLQQQQDFQQRPGLSEPALLRERQAQQLRGLEGLGRFNRKRKAAPTPGWPSPPRRGPSFPPWP